MKLNLPTPVLERIGTDSNEARQLFATMRRGQAVEARYFSTAGRDLEVRFDDDGNPRITGYATVYDYAYDVYGGAPLGWTETIAAGAASKSVAQRDDVRFLINHDGLALARTKSKTMTLESDNVGLFVDATFDARSPLVQGLVSSLERGDTDEMSFAFQVLRQEWNEDYTQRNITEVKLFDVSAVTYPANPATVIGLRSDTIVETPAVEADEETDENEDAEPAPEPGMSLDLANAYLASL